MHSDFEKLFSQADNFYKKGKFQDAIIQLDRILSVSSLRIKEKLATKFLKTLSLTQQKEYDKAIIIADSIIEESKKNKLDLYSVDGILAKAAIENDRRKMRQSLKLIKNAEKILNGIQNKSLDSLRIRQSNLLKIKGWSYLYNNQISKSLDCFEQRIDLSRKSGDKFEIGESLNDTGVALTILGERDTALKFHMQAVKLFEMLGLKRHLAITYNYISNIYHNGGATEEALNYERKYNSTRNSIKEN